MARKQTKTKKITTKVAKPKIRKKNSGVSRSVAKKVPIGGMSFANGLMMRTPNYMSVAIRDDVGRIEMSSFCIKDYRKKYPLFYIPFLRGVAYLLENLFFLAKLSIYKKRIEQKELRMKTKTQRIIRRSNQYLIYLLYSLIFLAVFNFIYSMLNSFSVINWENFLYNFLLTIFCIVLFVFLYIILAVSHKDKIEILEYHAVEHKIINAYEHTGKVDEKTLDKASHLHNRCGTFVLFWSFIVFSLLLSFLRVGVFNWFWGFILSIGLIFISFAIAYEFVRFIVTRRNKALFNTLVRPLYIFQSLTTHTPDEKHINLGIIVFQELLRMEKTK